SCYSNDFVGTGSPCVLRELPVTTLFCLLTRPLGQTVYCQCETAKGFALDRRICGSEPTLAQGVKAVQPIRHLAPGSCRPANRLPLLRAHSTSTRAHDPEHARDGYAAGRDPSRACCGRCVTGTGRTDYPSVC